MEGLGPVRILFVQSGDLEKRISYLGVMYYRAKYHVGFVSIRAGHLAVLPAIYTKPSVGPTLWGETAHITYLMEGLGPVTVETQTAGAMAAVMTADSRRR